MLDFVFPPYHLSVNQEPFWMELFRNGESLLVSQPGDLAITGWQQVGQEIHILFPQSTLNITQADGALDFRWQSESGDIWIKFKNNGSWFGQGELVHQHWPLDRMMQPFQTLITDDNGGTGLSCIQTPAWLSSNGITILVHSPIQFGLNQPPDHFPSHTWDPGPTQAPMEQRPCVDEGGEGDGCLTLADHDLHFEILLADSLSSATMKLVDRLGHPAALPPAELFKYPTWTTWVRFGTHVDQTKVLRFANEILAHDYPFHVIEIDDRWQVMYGDFSFDPTRFPDPKGMIDQLHDLGFKVTAWVMPFLDPRSEAFKDGAKHNYLLHTATGEPYIVQWWQGWGGVLDATNPQAMAWFGQRLQHLQSETGLDGFKFDAGETRYVPEDAIWFGRETGEAPNRNDYTHAYVDWVSRNYALTEVRSGWLNQNAPIFFRQWDKTTDWSYANGLKSVIPGLLSLSLTGYPFILPDMIAGNAYMQVADAELMIRWTQLNALLPAMQFSLAPWDYGEECAEICRRYAELHLEFTPLILKLADEAVRSGKPIIRPVSWLDPKDERLLLCDDEFLLGDEILVAPVVHQGMVTRDIYLPTGSWQAYKTDRIVQGPVVLQEYPAPLDHLPIFLRSK